MVVGELLLELWEFMNVCCKNLLHAQELQKWAYNKAVKSRSYVPSDKVWLNGKYIKIKWNRKLEAKFFGLFRVLHPMEKQAYKLELSKKWRIHDVFHVSSLEQDITRKKQVEETQSELDTCNREEYKVEAIRDNAIYVRESESDHISGFYHLIS